ncbi:MAG TPA: plastocyanin/azurin family copper-binding protein [Longimicrobiales bacterium]
MTANARPTVGVVLLAFLCAPLVSCVSERTAGDITDPRAVCSLTIEQLKSGDVFVPIRGFAFQRDTVRVAAGTRVTWVNCESPPADPHTVTADAGVWDSPPIPIGEAFSRTFTTPGTFPYHCIPHPFMRGVVIVQ